MLPASRCDNLEGACSSPTRAQAAVGLSEMTSNAVTWFTLAEAAIGSHVCNLQEMTYRKRTALVGLVQCRESLRILCPVRILM